jgi:hypothetical protein
MKKPLAKTTLMSKKEATKKLNNSRVVPQRELFLPFAVTQFNLFENGRRPSHEPLFIE